MSPAEIVNVAEFHVYERALYKMPERRPQPNGVLDPRLGVSNKRAICDTCGQGLTECTGHFGYIRLELPVFHIGYFKNTVQILQAICKGCSRVLLPDEERRRTLRSLRSARIERVQREAVFKRLLDRCKRVRQCPRCGVDNGVVKKAPSSLKIVHDPYSKNARLSGIYRQEFDDAVKHNEGLGAHLNKVVDDLHPVRVLQVFSAIPQEDCELLDLQGRPEDLLMTHLPVPPVCIRPSVEMDTGAGSNEDDITMKLMQIVEVNNILRQGLEKGLPIVNLMENWDFLQVQCAMYINSDLPGLSSMYNLPGKPMRGFVQRLKGKQGRFRGNLSGKRVDFSGRTVISPDPNLRVDEVCVPQLMALVLTYPDRVTEHNIEKLKQRVLNGTSQWPGANFILFPSGDKVYLKFGDRRRIASELKIGDVVERHLDHGDVVLFNRQPSLHRMSIMAHRARVMPWRTLRFNECVCAPYNADFDGDEMNIHVPQTEEARAEAYHLMGVMNNLCTPKSGEILIAATQDFLTSAYLLTSKDRFLTRPEICQMVAYMTDNKQSVDLPPPAIVKPVELWSGKQLFSLLIRPNASVKIFANLETTEKIYTSGQHLCPMDGFVCFYNSHLISGRLGKVTLGGGNKSGLFQVLNTDYSPRVAAECMNRLAKLSARFIGDRGFSIGIDDVTPKERLLKAKAATLETGYGKCGDFITQHRKGLIDLAPGCDADESLENAVTGVLNNIREAAAKVCMNTLHYHNSPLIMSQCGSKGSPINIAQMVACVGQQSVGGKRAPNGFKDRTLPHFPRGDRSPAGKGFVANSFYSGLTPTEFFFHTMAGREGLVDTAVKTAETGYMSRRLMKALEDLYTHYDGTVRNAAGGIVQLRYGEDGMDPVVMEGKGGEPVMFSRVLSVVKASQPKHLPGPAGAERQRQQQPGAGAGPAAMEVDGGVVESPTAGGKRRRGAKRPPASPAAARPLSPGSPMGSPLSPRSPTAAAAAAAVLAAAADGSGGRPLVPLPEQLQQAVDAAMSSDQLRGDNDFCSEKYRDSVRGFLEQQVSAVRTARKRLGLPAGQRGAYELERLVNPVGVTAAELATFVEQCTSRYESKRIDPGATVGAFGAQSIGEPGTQMTLKTFHFAGVASMNVTLGVPRIKEIINAAKNISTPIMKVALEIDKDETSARFVQGRLERTRLGQVARHIRTVLQNGQAMVEVKLNLNAIGQLQLELDAFEVRRALLAAPKLKLKPEHVSVLGEGTLEVRPPDDGKRELLFQLQWLVTALPEVIVQGIPTVDRAVINRQEKDQSRFHILVEGTNLQAVMGTLGVNARSTTTNHIMEVQQFLGIEAARKTIMDEIQTTMKAHGMIIDDRHAMLLADCMTYKGEVLGITRFGIAKMKDSVLMLASFEKTTDHLFDAALHGRCDDINGVSESIIMGIPMPTGTGLFKVMQRAEVAPAVLRPRPPPLLAF
ncbi:DNA-directed RNA polymerase III subunit rpc1-like isoform X2 [Micractinium conductrix]|uniref:DNA-directed RNA polymerase subunit n=1 Tax=Micractinium conductrix TaxID=554055 RepID=A0A2P6VIN8_9CHLO|nr:DNA-directed RNA polymerase III subunit rpc1-like isoform X2 [Micractinium conductrix]|eukprot:PSC73949.1 DNA-directed RNA polymerase III subunit rpc1-like isoform X2 [Micractinium conductrix]